MTPKKEDSGNPLLDVRSAIPDNCLSWKTRVPHHEWFLNDSLLKIRRYSWNETFLICGALKSDSRICSKIPLTSSAQVMPYHCHWLLHNVFEYNYDLFIWHSCHDHPPKA